METSESQTNEGTLLIVQDDVLFDINFLNDIIMISLIYLNLTNLFTLYDILYKDITIENV